MQERRRLPHLLRNIPSLIILIACCTLAQEQQVPDVSKTPLQEMQNLSVLDGNWTMTVFVTEDAGRTWTATPRQNVVIDYVHQGFMLEEVPQDLAAPGFHMRTMITYDQYRQVFRKAALDDVWGILDIYAGSISDGQLVLDNLASETFFPVGEDTWRGFRLTMELKPGLRWMFIDKTDDKGKSWQPAFKVEYRKP